MATQTSDPSPAYILALPDEILEDVIFRAFHTKPPPILDYDDWMFDGYYCESAPTPLEELRAAYHLPKVERACWQINDPFPR